VHRLLIVTRLVLTLGVGRRNEERSFAGVAYLTGRRTDRDPNRQPRIQTDAELG